MSESMFQQLEICQRQRDAALVRAQALQLRLNAADQWNDELLGLLREAAEFEVGENDQDAWEDLLSQISLQLAPLPAIDDSWHMNPCKQGHRDVGAAGGVAACNQCDEKIEAATTQEAFEQWNATHPPVSQSTPQPFTEQFIADHLGKKPEIPAERDHQMPGTSGLRLNTLANQGE